jgi:hypothetical protein
MPDPDLITQLLDLLVELTGDSEDYLDRQDDPQLWYNRGYANGMAAALSEQGLSARIAERVDADPYEAARDQSHLPWGKAYEHGREKGYAEAVDVLRST